MEKPGSIDMEGLEELANQALDQGMAVYSAHIRKMSRGYHLEIELDDMKHPLGAVNVEQCETFSAAFVLLLDRAIAEKSISGIPEDLTPENYSLQVSSAGAERILKSPAEIERFKGKPLKIKFASGDFHSSALGVFHSFAEISGRESIVFELFIPARQRKNKKRLDPFIAERKAPAAESKAKHLFYLFLDEISQINLYLDF